MSKESGRAAKSAGDAFEAFLETHHERALQRGILAHVIHNQATTNMVGGRLIYVAKGGADYSGCLGNGIAFAAEAKSTKAGRLARSAIEPKQAAHLDAVAAAGGLALLLVEFRHGDPLWIPTYGNYIRAVIPWKKVPWKVKKSAESLSMVDVTGWATQEEFCDCYLSCFFTGTGIPSAAARRRVFPRE